MEEEKWEVGSGTGEHGEGWSKVFETCHRLLMMSLYEVSGYKNQCRRIKMTIVLHFCVCVCVCDIRRSVSVGGLEIGVV